MSAVLTETEKKPPTPLQAYLTGLKAKGGLSLDLGVIAVGTDSSEYSGADQLCKGVMSLVKASTDGKVVPNCLSWGMEGEWTEDKNKEWLGAALKNESGALLPTFCYVFHTKINKALAAAATDMVVDVATFDTKFKQLNGNEGPSYKEVKKILEAGFVVIVPNTHGGVKLKVKAA